MCAQAHTHMHAQIITIIIWKRDILHCEPAHLMPIRPWHSTSSCCEHEGHSMTWTLTRSWVFLQCSSLEIGSDSEQEKMAPPLSASGQCKRDCILGALPSRQVVLSIFVQSSSFDELRRHKDKWQQMHGLVFKELAGVKDSSIPLPCLCSLELGTWDSGALVHQVMTSLYLKTASGVFAMAYFPFPQRSKGSSSNINHKGCQFRPLFSA